MTNDSNPVTENLNVPKKRGRKPKIQLQSENNNETQVEEIYEDS